VTEVDGRVRCRVGAEPGWAEHYRGEADCLIQVTNASVLPPADPPFRGEINVAFTDSKADFPEPLRAPAGAPNVLVVVGDDIGYGHMGAFGGPARTPTFDRLAERGLKYTNYHVTAVCSASRACLLTGRNSHSVGMGVIPESSTGFPGYNAQVPRSAAPRVRPAPARPRR
jgi:hypothetical protein